MSRRMALQIKRYGRSFLILIALMIVGTASGFYILLQQRLPNPFQTFYFAHNINSMLSVADAHGVAWRGLLVVSCGSLKGSVVGPLLETLLGTTFGC